MKFWLPLTSLLVPFTAARGGVTVCNSDGQRTCTVTANGDEINDVPNIVKAFNKCNKDAKVVFPRNETYWIAEKLHVTLDNVTIDWHGKWQVSYMHMFSTLLVGVAVLMLKGVPCQVR